MSRAKDATPAPWEKDLLHWWSFPGKQVRGMCFTATEQFEARYPQLRVVHGAGSNLPWHEARARIMTDTDAGVVVSIHAWLVECETGLVVDPTKKQHGRLVFYTSLRDGNRWFQHPHYMYRTCPECQKRLPAGYKWGQECCTTNDDEWCAKILEVPCR